MEKILTLLLHFPLIGLDPDRFQAVADLNLEIF